MTLCNKVYDLPSFYNLLVTIHLNVSVVQAKFETALVLKWLLTWHPDLRSNLYSYWYNWLLIHQQTGTDTVTAVEATASLVQHANVALFCRISSMFNQLILAAIDLGWFFFVCILLLIEKKDKILLYDKIKNDFIYENMLEKTPHCTHHSSIKIALTYIHIPHCAILML